MINAIVDYYSTYDLTKIAVQMLLICAFTAYGMTISYERWIESGQRRWAIMPAIWCLLLFSAIGMLYYDLLSVKLWID